MARTANRSGLYLCRAHRAVAGRRQSVTDVLCMRRWSPSANMRLLTMVRKSTAGHAAATWRRKGRDRWKSAAGKEFAVRLRIPDYRAPLQRHCARPGWGFAAETVSDPVLVRSASGASGGVPVYNYGSIGYGHYARDSRRRPYFKHAQASGDLRSLWLADTAVRYSSIILGPDGERLSKCHGAASIFSLPADGLPA